MRRLRASIQRGNAIVVQNPSSSLKTSHREAVALRDREAPNFPADASVGEGCGTIQAQFGARCRSCRAPARVHVLRGYCQGRPIRSHFCSRCFHGADFTSGLPGDAGRRLRLSDSFIICGAALTAFALSSDLLLPNGLGGFGAYQCGGLLLGLFLVLLGGVIRIGLIAMSGIAAAAGSALADVLDLHGRSGFGWKQSAAVVAGILTIVVGLIAQWRSRPMSTTSNIRPESVGTNGISCPVLIVEGAD